MIAAGTRGSTDGAPDAPSDPSAASPAASAAAAGSLAGVLRRLGLDCDVRAVGAMAVLVAGADGYPSVVKALADDSLRATVERLSREHGFTHVALELREEDLR